RLDNGVLFQEQTSHRIAQNGQRVCVSPDGKYVCLPSGGGNYQNLPDHPAVGTYTTYVYPFDNLQKPTCIVPSGAYPRTVGFDIKNGLIFAQNFDTHLRIF